MSIITKNIDSCPYTGTRYPKGKVRVKTHEEAPYLDKFFNGTENVEQVQGITRGKEYEVISVSGLGDVEEITITDDNGNEQTFADFFFTEDK